MPATVVETKYGSLRGLEQEVDGSPVHAFLGVPFVQQPVGANRLRPPQPLPPWTGVREAVKYGNSCPQQNMPPPFAPNNLETGEDCLWLNVWRPAGAKSGDNLPVLVWIHGGGFQMGSPSEPLWDGKYLAKRQNAVVVNLGYRLGLLAFLHIEGVVGPNLALLDQQAGLKWVNENIAGFGGNPENVTLVGESAGSASVCWHYITPESQPFFARAIAMSGGTDAYWAFRRPDKVVHEDSVAFVKERGGDPDASPEDILKFLQSLPLEDFAGDWKKPRRIGLVPDAAYKRNYQNAQATKPLLLTMCKYEGDLVCWLLPNLDFGKALLLNDRSNETFRSTCNNMLQPVKAGNHSALIDKFFDLHQDDPHACFKAASDLISDSMENMSGLHFLRDVQSGKSDKVYFGVFDFIGTSFEPYMTEPFPPHIRCTHGTDCPLLFGTAHDSSDEDEVKMTEVVQQVLASFISQDRPAEEWKPAKLNQVIDPIDYCVMTPAGLESVRGPIREETIKLMQQIYD